MKLKIVVKRSEFQFQCPVLRVRIGHLEPLLVVQEDLEELRCGRRYLRASLVLRLQLLCLSEVGLSGPLHRVRGALCAHEYRTYDVKSNSFSKWKQGAWAPGCASEIGLAVVDLTKLPGVEDALPDEKSTPYFYSVMAAFEKRATPLFAEVKRWLFISGFESHRLQTMEFVNSHGAFKSLHVDFADYHQAKFERLGDLSAGQATRSS